MSADPAPYVQRSLAGAVHLAHPLLERRGISHGFIGKPLNFIKTHRIESARALARALGADGVAVLNQVHGDRILELPGAVTEEPVGEADGIVFPLITPGRAIAVGVRTADCVPLLLVGSRWAAAVHAGWRGLAQDIVGKAAAELRRRDGEGEILAFIGPCAGPGLYEVGGEVVQALGAHGVSQSVTGGKYLLNLAATAVKELAPHGVKTVQISPICTIADERFHSFRRDREKTGNNLGFLLTSRG